MKLGFLLVGLFFLFNPNVGLFDLLPDAVGYGLILYGILRLSRTDVRISEAARAFKRLFILELCKLPALYVYALVSKDEQLWILIFSLVFGILEALFGFFAWPALFDGLDSLAEEGGQNIRGKYRPILVLTLIFTVVKPLLCILPDLTLLADGQYGVVTGNGIQTLRNYRTAFTFLAALAVLIFGIVWLVLTFIYFYRMKQEKDFLARLEARIGDYNQKTEKLLFQFLSSLLGLLFVALLFSLELKVEGYSLIPPMVNGLLFLIFFLLIRKQFDKTAKIGIAGAAVWLFFSTVGWFLALRFSWEYYLEDVGIGFSEIIFLQIENNFDVLGELELVALMVFFACVGFGVMIFALYRLFGEMIDRYTGVSKSNLSEKDRTEAIRRLDEREDLAIKTGLKKPLRWLLATGILTAVSSALFPLLQIYFFPFFTIDLAIRVLFVVVFSLYVSKLRAAVQVKGGIEKV